MSEEIHSQRFCELNDFLIRNPIILEDMLFMIVV